MNTAADDRALLEGLRAAAHRLVDGPEDFNPLLEAIGNKRFVLLGEASHGTHEFYRLRAQLTQLLIGEFGFDAVVVEADWPDALRVNAYVQGHLGEVRVREAFADFQRFPKWMWRNREVVELVRWMRSHNAAQLEGGPRAGFYGMDLYSLHASMRQVVDHLERVDPRAAARARERYRCFEMFGEDPAEYGASAHYGGPDTCEDEVVEQLLELQRNRPRVAGAMEADEHFFAEQNARLAANAERYYRAMYAGRHTSWNLRDTHMADTLDALVGHLERRGHGPARIVVWAHNSHLGDARATEMGDAGELNLGQLVRERHPGDSFHLGFTTHTGTVVAAAEWDEPGRLRGVRESLPGSYERLFHDTGLGNFLLRMDALGEAGQALAERRLERAIGVIYAPRTERHSHYFHASLPRQFDAVIHLDETRGLTPLDADPGSEREDAADTFPSGL